MPTTNADTPSPIGSSLEEAAKLIEGILDPPDADTETPTTDAADATPTDGESVAAEAKSKETPPTEEEGEPDEADASDDAENTETAEERPATITVKIDGKEEAITLEEAAKGYQRQADYSRKMADFTTERKTFETEVQAVRGERETYRTMLVALRDTLQQAQPEEPDWAEVFKTDPVGYARRRDEWRDKQDKIAAASFELERLRGEERKEQQENLRKMVGESRVKMLELNPAWRDQKVWEADRQSIVKYAQDNGYSAEEISAAYDPRAIVMFNKARLYDELMANKPKPTEVRRPKAASAGAARDTSVSNRLNSAQQRLAKSGRIEDAAKVFEQII